MQTDLNNLACVHPAVSQTSISHQISVAHHEAEARPWPLKSIHRVGQTHGLGRALAADRTVPELTASDFAGMDAMVLADRLPNATHGGMQVRPNRAASEGAMAGSPVTVGYGRRLKTFFQNLPGRVGLSLRRLDYEAIAALP